MKYWLFIYTVVHGERSVILKRAVAIAEGSDIKNHAQVWLRDYFGERTEIDEDGLFWSPDRETCVKYEGAREISKEEFEVLAKYL